MTHARHVLVVLVAVACSWTWPSTAWAQDRPVVFLHGLASSGATWTPTAYRMRDRTTIAPRMPNLDWRATYAQQSRSLMLHPEIGSLPATTVTVGHSNGGIVARDWSRVQRMGGIVTLGTPHYGAPIVSRFTEWTNYQRATPDIVGWVMHAFSRPSNGSWVLSHLSAAMALALEFSWSSVLDLAATLAIDYRHPIMSDMRPGSPYLSALNTASNLHREAVDAPRRMGIVSIADNFYWAGPARAPFPEHADEIAAVLYGTIAGLEFWASWVLINSEPGDFDAIEQAQSLFALAAHLASVDPVFCAIVSNPYINECVPNDGVLPITTQRYPNALNVTLGWDGSRGPVHTRLIEQSDDVLYHALVEVMQIAPRSYVPPPPTPPPSTPNPPGSPGDPTGGGGGGQHRADVLMPDEMLRPGERVVSQDGRFELVYQHDGNLVLYHHGRALWATGTNGYSAGKAIMQTDGNFVVYDANHIPLWASGASFGYDGAWLIVQNDGNVVIYTESEVPLWATNTVQ